MKKLLLILLFSGSLSGICQAGQFVNGYVKSNGNYVGSYYRSSPTIIQNSNPYNTIKTSGSYNPYIARPVVGNPNQGVYTGEIFNRR